MNGTVGQSECGVWDKLGCTGGLCESLRRRRWRRRVMPETAAVGQCRSMNVLDKNQPESSSTLRSILLKPIENMPNIFGRESAVNHSHPLQSKESRRRINHPPAAQYNAFSEHFRTTAPAALQCALFCGGARCQYELPQQPRPTAIQGLYSDWITEDILAMARPSTAGIAARNIIQQFHSWGIKTVINLQTPGEHASCGPPLTSSGFTYEPSIFMANDIYYYNFAWPDYGEATLAGLLDMTKVISFALDEGRVAIHCHAGLGRTGVLIACYLVYSLRIRGNDAIRLVRKKRPRSVQTSGQILCVQQFEHYLLPQTVVFSSKEPLLLTKDSRTAEFTLRQHLHRQRATLHGLQERNFKELPKIVYCLCERLLNICGCQQSLGLDFRIRSRPFYKSFLTYRIKQRRPPDPRSPEPEPCTLPPISMVEWRDKVDEEIQRNLEAVSRLTGSSSGGILAAVHVYDAFLIDHHSLHEDKRKKMKQLRDEINMKAEAINQIDEENDPEILTGLLLEWLERLKQPVLDREDLSTIITRSHDLESCVASLPLEDVILLEYLLHFVIRLRPLAGNKKINILRRLLASLAHQTLSINGKYLPTHKDFSKLRDGTSDHVLNFMLKSIVELQRYLIKPGWDDTDVVMSGRRFKYNAWK